MEEDGGEGFEGGKNRNPQHIHQNLEHCENSCKSLPLSGQTRKHKQDSTL